MNSLEERPQYAVLFISERDVDPAPEGYADMDNATMEAVSKLEGFVGYDVARTGKNGIFVSYWRDLESIDAWRNHTLHREAKKEGSARWYDAYRTVITKIEHFSDFRRNS